MPTAPSVKALLFDVFGTCVDWRSGVIREVTAAARARGRAVDAAAFADAWRGQYQPSMEEVRSGRRPFAVLDVLHGESLAPLLPGVGLGDLDEPGRADLVRAWHRLDPWPDTIPGLTRLKRRYVIAPLSNGNVALLTNMAKRAGLPWDLILSAETARAYKPQPESYLRSVAMLGLGAGEVMMCAAHNGDLRAAAACGLRTAFVPRPTEHGPGQTTDLAPEGAWDVVAGDFVELAARLGA